MSVNFRFVQVMVGICHSLGRHAALPSCHPQQAAAAAPHQETGMKTSVCIIGGGPSGLMLSQLLH
jgi:NADPH-dependent 2,4-dienoyl-CoA reductase/sulfur reductase-like enzyme